MKILRKLKAVDWGWLFDKAAFYTGQAGVIFGILLMLKGLHFDGTLKDLIVGFFVFVLGMVTTFLVQMSLKYDLERADREFDLLVKLAELKATTGDTGTRDIVIANLERRFFGEDSR